MMGPAGYLLAILGCGEGDAPCQQVQLAPVRYESQADCLAAQDDVLLRYDGGEFPVTVVQCRPADQRVASLTADEVRLPEPRGRRVVQSASARR